MIPATIGNLRITSSFEDEQSSFEDAGKLIIYEYSRARDTQGSSSLAISQVPTRDSTGPHGR